MVTIKMIAARSGYSVATVSKALNGAQDISADTAAKIRKIASSMGYMPNAAARALKTTRSYSLGVLFEDATNAGLTHPFFSQILESFKHRAQELGYDIGFVSNRLGGREISYTGHARYRNFDGVVVASVGYDAPEVMELAASGIPLVTIDYSFHQWGSVLSDNISGIKELVEYVHGLGHRRIAFIHGEVTAVTRSRLASFHKTCQTLGLSIPPEYIVPGIYHDADSSAAATKGLMSLADPPTCILYPDDVSYIGGRNELKKMGLSIPSDISAAGYDGIETGQLMTPSLTTVRQGAREMGRLAAEELVRAVEDGKAYIPQLHVVPGELLPGETVGRLR